MKVPLISENKTETDNEFLQYAISSFYYNSSSRSNLEVFIEVFLFTKFVFQISARSRGSRDKQLQCFITFNPT